MKTLRWTSRDLDLFPEENTKRYEIIDGELYVSKQPHYHHQLVCAKLLTFLNIWSIQTEAGEATGAPGLIFADDEDVAPDVAWTSKERLMTALRADGKLHISPELVVEVLSPGSVNANRDRELKRNLYARRGAEEYWIVDWQKRQLEVYRRKGSTLEFIGLLNDRDVLQTPLLPEFRCQVGQLFATVYRQ